MSIPSELADVGFVRYPYQSGYQHLFTREAYGGGIRFLVVYSDGNGPTGWACDVYASEGAFLAGEFPLEHIPPEPFVWDLVQILRNKRLIV